MIRAFPGAIVCPGVLVRVTDAELVVEPLLTSLPRWTASRSVFTGAHAPGLSGDTITQIRRISASGREALRHSADEDS